MPAVFVVVAHMLVERLVFVLGNIVLGTRPQCGSLVDGLVLVGDDLAALLPLFLFHHDGLNDMVGVFVDDGTQLVAAEQIVLIGTQMQRDLAAACGFFHHLDGKFAAAIRFPTHALIGLLSGTTGGDDNLVGHDERGIETHAELADQTGILLLITAQFREEFARADFAIVPRLLITSSRLIPMPLSLIVSVRASLL